MRLGMDIVMRWDSCMDIKSTCELAHLDKDALRDRQASELCLCTDALGNECDG